jgi:glucan phosphoethanolaminetransferase (alkaline phosphatase superfamily)
MAMEAKDHAKLLGIFFLIVGAFSALMGLIFGVVYGLMGVMVMATGEKEGAVIGGVFVILAVILGIILLAIAALNISTGWKFFKGSTNGKLLAIIASVLVLLSFPFGTALGIYSLWFIFGDQGKAYFSGIAVPGTYSTPPPPNSWQQ